MDYYLKMCAGVNFMRTYSIYLHIRKTAINGEEMCCKCAAVDIVKYR